LPAATPFLPPGHNTAADPPIRHSDRSNKGKGGANDQLQKVFEKIAPSKKRKKTAQDSIPLDEAENPLAPPELSKRQKVKKAQVSLLDYCL
jgi:hypothetical protein